jgi:hypothetical protein
MAERRKDDPWRESIRVQLVEQGSLYNRLDERVEHLEERVGQIAADTSWLREVLNDAAAAIRLLCRLAKWWRFGIRYVLLPIASLMALPYLLYLVWYWFAHDYTLPLWVEKLIALWK